MWWAAHAEFVTQGGSYLGLCAGAYYACARVEFEPGTPLEVVGDRELAFFPGIAQGAAFPGQSATCGVSASTPRPSSARSALASPKVVLILWQTWIGSWNQRDIGWAPLGLRCNKQSVRLMPCACVLDCTYAGFDYLTEAGAVAAQVGFSVPQELSALLDQQDCSSSSDMTSGHQEDGRTWITTFDYANGGPVLLAVDGNPDLKQLPSVTVLARYGQLPPSAAPAPAQPAHQQQRQRQDATGRVAAVRCAVGKGVAVLCGTHPELGPEWLDPCGESNAAQGPQPPEAATSSPSAQAAAAAGASIPQQQREQGQQAGSQVQVVVEDALDSSLCSSGEGQTVVCRDVALAAHAQQLQAQLRASQAGRDLLLCSLLYHALASHLRA